MNTRCKIIRPTSTFISSHCTIIRPRAKLSASRPRYQHPNLNPELQSAGSGISRICNGRSRLLGSKSLRVKKGVSAMKNLLSEALFEYVRSSICEVLGEEMESAAGQPRYIDGLLILCISFASAWICEAISWLLIYRTSSYKTLRNTIDRTSKKLENMKSSTAPAAALSAKKSKVKKMDRFETSLKESSRDLSFSKFKSGAVVAVVLIVVFGLLSNLFEGKAVAKLPFMPIPLIQKMTHRGLPGDDPTDCSMVFLYFLCSVSIRYNLQKFLGFSPPRGAAGANMFGIPETKSR